MQRNWRTTSMSDNVPPSPSTASPSAEGREFLSADPGRFGPERSQFLAGEKVLDQREAVSFVAVNVDRRRWAVVALVKNEGAGAECSSIVTSSPGGVVHALPCRLSQLCRLTSCSPAQSAVWCSAGAGWTTSEHPLSAWAVTSRRRPARRQAISSGCRDQGSMSEHAASRGILWGRRPS